MQLENEKSTYLLNFSRLVGHLLGSLVLLGKLSSSDLLDPLLVLLKTSELFLRPGLLVSDLSAVTVGVGIGLGGFVVELVLLLLTVLGTRDLI